MTNSTPLPLRPMNIGELLDGAITLYRNNFLTLVGIVAIVNVPYLLVQVITIVLAFPADFTDFSRRASAPFSNSFLIYLIVIVVIAIPIGVAYIFQHGALTTAASEFFLGGRIGIKQARGHAFSHGWTLFGTQWAIGMANLLVQGLLVVSLFTLLLAPSASGAAGNAALGIAVISRCTAFLPALALVAILNNSWIFRSRTVMLESKRVRSGPGRGWQLVGGSFERVLFIAAMAYIVIATITATPTYALSIILVMLPSLILASGFNSTVSILTSIFTTPLWFALRTLLYYNICIHKEGCDLEFQALQLAETPT